MALDLSRIRGLCFDIDGTLSDTDDHLVARFSRGLGPFRRFLFGRSPAQVARRIVLGIESPGNFLLGIPDRLGMDDQVAFALNYFNRLGIQRRRDVFWLVPGVRQALEALHPHYPMSVVSARDEGSTRIFLKQFELESFFQGVATARTCAHTKPYPDPIVWAAEKMGVAPTQCLMIGDTTVDVRAGRAAGAQTLGVLCGFGEEPELRRAGADLIIPSTALVPEVLFPQASPGSSPGLPVHGWGSNLNNPMCKFPNCKPHPWPLGGKTAGIRAFSHGDFA